MRIKKLGIGLNSTMQSAGYRSAKRAASNVVTEKVFNLTPDVPANLVVDVYISATGSDTLGDGTELNPYRTLGMCPKNSVIGMLAGDYYGWGIGNGEGSIDPLTNFSTTRSTELSSEISSMFAIPGDTLTGQTLNDPLNALPVEDLQRTIIGENWITAFGGSDVNPNNIGTSVIRIGAIWTAWFIDNPTGKENMIAFSAMNTYFFGIDYYSFYPGGEATGDPAPLVHHLCKVTGNVLFDLCWLETSDPWGFPSVPALISSGTIAGYGVPTFINCDIGYLNDLTELGDAETHNTRFYDRAGNEIIVA